MTLFLGVGGGIAGAPEDSHDDTPCPSLPVLLCVFSPQWKKWFHQDRVRKRSTDSPAKIMLDHIGGWKFSTCLGNWKHPRG